MSDADDNSDNNPDPINGVTPTDWRRLLTAAERTAMLHDIASVSLTAGIKLFPEQPWSDLSVAAGTVSSPKSPIEQLAFIEYLLPVLAEALNRIEYSPLTIPAVYTCAALPERARRVTVPEWMEYARHSPAKRHVNETRTTASHDTPENRAIKSFVAVLLQDCRVIAQIAAAEEETEAEQRAAGCAQRLRRLLSASWWDEIIIQYGDWTRLPTQRETMYPEYARVAQERFRYRQSFCFDWNHLLLTLSPRETWRLYELWCLLTVLQVLGGMGWEWTFPQDLIKVREGRLALTPAVGERSRIVLRSAQRPLLTLTYNQIFAEGRESLSHAMQPDITLSDGKRAWILDAKFKPYAEPGEEGEDINQMHAYRDAIIGGEGERNVVTAWCLYTGRTHVPNRAQITYGRSVGTKVGALCLRPANLETVRNLARLLERWLLAET